MAVENNRLLICQICDMSGLKGKELRELRAELETKTNSELSRMLAANRVNSNEGIIVEKTTPSLPKPQSKGVINLPLQQLSERQAQDLCIDYISQALIVASDILMHMNNGLVSKGFDTAKNLFNSELSSENLNEVILKEQDGLNYLLKAQSGTLTKREYWEQNKLRLKEMFLNRIKRKDDTGVDYIDKWRGILNKKEFVQLIDEYLEKKINSFQTLEELKTCQHELIMMPKETEGEFVDKLLQDVVEKAKNPNNVKDTSDVEVNALRVPQTPHPLATDEPMSFDEVYKLERGVEFSETTMSRLRQAKEEFEVATGAYNKLQGLRGEAKALTDEYTKATEPVLDESGNVSFQPSEPKAEDRKKQVLDLVKRYYGLMPQNAAIDLYEIINSSKLNLSLVLDENGELDIEFDEYHQDDVSKNKALNLLLRGLVKKQESRFNELLGDKTYEDYATAYQRLNDNGMGKQSSEELAQAMETQNQTFLDNSTNILSTGGMGVMVVGGLILGAPVVLGAMGIAAPAFLTGATATMLGEGAIAAGGKIAMSGMATRDAFGTLEAVSRREKSDEEIERRLKDIVMDAGGFAFGVVAGAAGTKLSAHMLRNGSKFGVAKLVEHGTDFAISVAGDLAMIGALQYDQGFGATLKGNLIGIIVSSVAGLHAGKQLAKQEGSAATKGDVNIPKGLTENEIAQKQKEFDAELLSKTSGEIESKEASKPEGSWTGNFTINKILLEAGESEFSPRLQAKRDEIHEKRMLKYGTDNGLPPRHRVNRNIAYMVRDVQFERGEYTRVQFAFRNEKPFDIKMKKWWKSLYNAMEPTKETKTLYRAITPYNGFESQIKNGLLEMNSLTSTCAKYDNFFRTWSSYGRIIENNTSGGQIKHYVEKSYIIKINVEEGTKLLDCNMEYKPLFSYAKTGRMNAEVVLPPGYGVVKSIDNELNVIEIDFKPIEVKFDANGKQIIKNDIAMFTSKNVNNIKWQVDSKYTSKYTAAQNQKIYDHAQKYYNEIAKETEALYQEYNQLFGAEKTADGTLVIKNGDKVIGTISQRAKDFATLNEKIYREIERVDNKIRDLGNLDKYNRKQIEKGKKPLTQEQADIEIERLQIQRENLINDFDTVKETVIDAYGARIVLNDVSPESMEKVYNDLINAIDNDLISLTDIENYAGSELTAYFTKEQVVGLRKHLIAKQQEASSIIPVDGRSFEDDAVVLKPNGYTTFQINIRHKNGIITEFQLRGSLLNDFAEAEHLRYDLTEGKNPAKKHPEFTDLLKPLEEANSKLAKPENNDLNEAYSKYLKDYYEYVVLTEKNIFATKPKFPDGIDECLKVENLIEIHHKMEKIKAKK